MTKDELLSRLATPDIRERLEEKAKGLAKEAGVSIGKAVKGLTDIELYFTAQRMSDLRIQRQLENVLKGGQRK